MDAITLPKPDDWHVHLRDGDALAVTVPASARGFGRVLAMPNTTPPVRTADEALAYGERVRRWAPADFEPYFALYLTDGTTPAEVGRSAATAGVLAYKLYPAGATTNSHAGVTAIERLDPVFAALAEHGLALCVHGEVTDPDVDVFDREAVFLDRVLTPLMARHPALRVVVEHITTAEAVDFVRGHGPNVAATITPQHVLLDRNALFQGGIRPHHHCLPVLKRAKHRDAVLAAATSGDPKFFLGSDSAPHARRTKEAACGCAGIFTAPWALGLYAEAFDAAGALDRLPAFASVHGAQFYGLPVATETITLTRAPEAVPASLPYLDDALVPLRAGEAVRWRIRDDAAAMSP